MKDPRFNKAIKNIKEIFMTSAEKQRILAQVLSENPVEEKIAKKTYTKSVKSPWSVYSFGTWIETHRWISAVAVLIIIVVVGNSAVLASYNALPGDKLYSVKVNVVEPIRLALATTPTIKAEIQTEFVQDRLQEAETLAARGRLDTVKENDINQRIEQQVSDLVTNIERVKKTSPEKADDINTTLEASVNTHERILDVIAINRGESRGRKTKLADVTPMIPEKAAPPAATAAMTAPTTAATPSVVSESDDMNKSTSASKRSESMIDQKKNTKYSKKKGSVESLIKATTADLTSATTTATSSPIQETMANDAQNTLNRAQEKLQEADEHNKNGNSGEAYSALIDSERSTKEAALFIKAKTRLEKEIRNEEMRKPDERANKEKTSID